MSFKDLAIRPRFWLGSILLVLFLAFQANLLPLTLPVQPHFIGLGLVAVFWILYGVSSLRFRLYSPSELHDMPLILFNILLTAFLVLTVLQNNELFAVPHLLIGLYFAWIFQKFTLGRTTSLPNIKYNINNQLKVTVKQKSQTLEKTLDQIQVGDTVIIFAGQPIWVDGVVTSGTTSVDESALTNEFAPVMKSLGSWVAAGSVNRDSTIEIEVKNTYNNSFYQNWIHSLQSNDWLKTTLNKKVTRMSQILFFIGVLATIACMAFYILKNQLSWQHAFQKSIFILPCFSTLALMPVWKFLYKQSLSHIFQKGIYIPEPNAFEKIGTLNSLFITKTGMLTKGKLAFSQCFLEMGTNQGDVLSTLFALESEATHPLSEAIETHPWFNEFDIPKTKKVENHLGLGVCGTVEPLGIRPYFAAVGNLRFLKRMQMHVSRDMRSKADDLERMGETVVFCGFKRQVKAVISFVDSLRKHIRESLRVIQKLGVELIFITGDSSESLRPITDSLNIENVYPRCTPEEKAGKIIKQKEKSKITGIVGTDDDVKAFEAADVSVSLATGTKTQGRKANVLILGKDFRRLAWLIKEVKTLFHSIKLVLTTSVFISAALAALTLFTNSSPIMILATLFVLNVLLIFINLPGGYKKKPTNQTNLKTSTA